MKIIIKETSAVESLSIIDPKPGNVDYISDFIGGTGAFTDGKFFWDEDSNAYVCDQKTFDWWHTVVKDHQALVNRINNLVQKHGRGVVFKVVLAVDVGLEDNAEYVNKALDEAFGSTA